ncbi:MAG: toprim domain-containing protein [Dysgonamonadaceae bacterium]|jgi:ABC-type dipeptide/oligopeptide/nickel transport system ATPase subunit|nr:toprim domain-containing protein [Dysgonamonadaceae bacterium]
MLNKDEILRLTNNGLDVFRHYIPGQWRVGRNFLNPLYEDRKASCNIYFDRRNDCYRMKDFGNDAFSGDCFDTVGKLKNLNCGNPKDFVEILEVINCDLHLGLSGDGDSTSLAVSISPKPVRESKPHLTPQPENLKKIKPYSIIEQSFSAKETEFWKQYGITPEILKAYKVFSLREFKSENSEGKPFTFTALDNEPVFGYIGKRHVKIYRPFSEIRFLYGGLLPDNYCFGLEQLPAKGDTLFITGCEKDVLSLVSHGFHAICFNSETSNIPQHIIKKLSYRFKHIILLYDADKTGLDASLKHAQQLADLGVKRLVLPLAGTKQEKDISDYFKLGNSRDNFIKLFIEFLDNLYNDTMAILKPCEIDFNNPPVQAEMIISINDVPLGTQGNLLGITGGEGTGKSNYVGSLIAGTVRDASFSIDTLGTTILPNTANKAVLLYDTEQSEVQLYKNIGNILKRGKQSAMPDYFKAYCLTSMSRKERLQAIVQSMDRFYYQFGGIQMVVIDGIADLVRCANDEAESVGVIDELYRLAGIYKTCIVCVLHFIPNGMKLRGHLGSELQRKAAAILSIEKDENPQISVVKALKVRDGSPLDVPLVQFSWDKELGMHTYFGEKPKEEKEKRKETELAGVAKTVFSKQRHCTYADLCGQIQSILDVKERTAKNYIRFMRDREIIRKDAGGTGHFIPGHING